MDSPGISGLETSTAAKMCGVLITLMTLATTNPASAVEIDGKEWRQPLDTMDFSYDDIAEACDVNTGACKKIADNYDGNGNGRTVDLRGWTWASVDEVTELFRILTDDPNGDFNGPVRYKNPNGPCWATNAIKDLDNDLDTGLFIETTLSADDHDGVYGLTRSVIVGGKTRNRANRTAIKFYLPATDSVHTDNPVEFDARRKLNGHWLYKKTSMLPDSK